METNKDEVVADVGGLTDERIDELFAPVAHPPAPLTLRKIARAIEREVLVAIGKPFLAAGGYWIKPLATKAAAEKPAGLDDRLDGLREAVSDFRKATYEFARGQDPEDHKRMMESQMRIFAEARALANAQPPEAAPAAPEQAVPEAVHHNFTTHRDAWRGAIVECINSAPPSGIDHDQKGYWEHELRAYDEAFSALAAPVLPVPASAPIQMILHCPKCGVHHIDAPDERTEGWTNPPHRSHLCHGCGNIWRPADVHTEGVKAIQTRGTNDSAPAEQPTPSVPRVTSIDTPELRRLMSAYEKAFNHGTIPETSKAWAALIAYIDAHVARQDQAVPDARAKFEDWWHEGPHPYRDAGGKKKPLLDEKSAWHVWQVAQAERAAVPGALFNIIPTMTPEKEAAAERGFCPACNGAELKIVNRDCGMRFFQCAKCKDITVLRDAAPLAQEVEPGKPAGYISSDAASMLRAGRSISMAVSTGVLHPVADVAIYLAAPSSTPGAAQAAPAEQRDAWPDEEALRDAVAEGLRGLYGCGRVWSAWSVGTMTEDDFYPAEESDECIGNVLGAIRALRSTSTDGSAV